MTDYERTIYMARKEHMKYTIKQETVEVSGARLVAIYRFRNGRCVSMGVRKK